MRILLDIERLLLRPARWAALLQDGAASRGAGNHAEAAVLRRYVAREFVAPRGMLIQRRSRPETATRDRFLLRPLASTHQSHNGGTWLGLVCDYDAARRALCVVEPTVMRASPISDFERAFSGEVFLESTPLAPAYCDNDAVRFFSKLPEAVDAKGSPADHWKDYLEWRKRLAETKASECYAYKGMEVRPRRRLRFILRDHHSVERLRQRFLDEELRAGKAGFGPSAPQGFFRTIVPCRSGTHRGALFVELEYDQATWDAAQRLPHAGELRVAMEGEIASLDVQANGLRRLAEGQAVNPRLSTWLFDFAKVPPTPEVLAKAWQPLISLNAEQQKAVGLAMNLEDVAFLWGPPGTGKTTVIAEICAQYALRGKRVLVASQSNLAVEQALSRLPESTALRSAWVSTARKREGTTGDIRGGMARWMRTLSLEGARLAEEHTTDARWREYLWEWSRRTDREAKEVRTADGTDEKLYLRHANIVGATCAETGKPDFHGSQQFPANFDLVIIDEVSKATPPELLLALLIGKGAVLAGDPRQLPPQFRDEAFEDAVENGEIERSQVERFRDLVSATWFEAAYQNVPASARLGLQRQYRMHPDIMEAINVFYADNPLRSGKDAKTMERERRHGLTLKTSAGSTWLRPDAALCWIDSGPGIPHMERGERRAGASRYNAAEAMLAAEVVSAVFHECRSAGYSIGAISFYRAQADLMREHIRQKNLSEGWLHPQKDVNTVDQFQGSERDVVIVSLVRAGGRLTGEFAKDFRRINVAFSRARRLLIVIGCANTFEHARAVVPTSDGTLVSLAVYRCFLEHARRCGGIHKSDLLWTGGEKRHGSR